MSFTTTPSVLTQSQFPPAFNPNSYIEMYDDESLITFAEPTSNNNNTVILNQQQQNLNSSATIQQRDPIQQCPICQKLFNIKSELNEHVNRCLDEQEIPPPKSSSLLLNNNQYIYPSSTVKKNYYGSNNYKIPASTTTTTIPPFKLKNVTHNNTITNNNSNNVFLEQKRRRWNAMTRDEQDNMIRNNITLCMRPSGSLYCYCKCGQQNYKHTGDKADFCTFVTNGGQALECDRIKTICPVKMPKQYRQQQSSDITNELYLLHQELEQLKKKNNSLQCLVKKKDDDIDFLTGRLNSLSVQQHSTSSSPYFSNNNNNYGGGRCSPENPRRSHFHPNAYDDDDVVSSDEEQPPLTPSPSSLFESIKNFKPF